MTEFEMATLAFQKETLFLRGLGVWAAFAHVGVSLLIGLGQIAIVWYGIRAMQLASDRRTKEQDQRHEEAMTALNESRESLRALIERTARA